MLTVLAGGRVVDPANNRDAVGDVWIEDGRVVAPDPGRAPDERLDATGLVVLAGAIDVHSHIAGANVNTARLLLPELRDTPAADCVPVSETVGRLYAQMGYTLVVEPAIPPNHAVQAQMELAEIPHIDRAILAVLGNEDFLMDLLRRGEGEAAVADYAGRALAGAKALGVKTINPGGAVAFRENARSFGLDDEVPGYGVSQRRIVEALQGAVDRLGLPHPLHLHCANLGTPGNVETALDTIRGTAGRRVHLAHLQFYAYGTEGPQRFSSAAARLAEAVNGSEHLTVDVGQVMFGQTVTVSCDVLRQFGARDVASPRKYAITDSEMQGAGIVPYRYRRTSFHNAVQWAAGLELFLLIADPWRVLLTTDHPNGAPFTAYPDLLALLMDRDLRAQWIATLPADAMAVTTLPGIAREYNWPEIAAMTRAAPARLLGLADRGHLAPGAIADVVAYRPQPDKAAMFRAPAYVFKRGTVIARDGAMVGPAAFGDVLSARPGFDRQIEGRLERFYEDIYGVSPARFDVVESVLPRQGSFVDVPCRR
jgi:formylmethanofuran dehydrogenase subunit A